MWSFESDFKTIWNAIAALFQDYNMMSIVKKHIKFENTYLDVFPATIHQVVHLFVLNIYIYFF